MSSKRRVISVETKPRLMLGVLDYLSSQDIQYNSMANAVNLFIQHHLDLYRTAETLPVYSSEEDAELLLSDRVMIVGKVTRLKQQGEAGLRSLSMAEQSAGNKHRGLESLRSAVNNSASVDTDFAPPSFNLNFEPKLSETNEDLDKLLRSAASMSVAELYPSQTESKEIFGFDDLDQIMQLAAAEHELEQEIDLLSKITLGTIDSNKPHIKIEKKQNSIDINDARLEKDKLYKVFQAEQDEAKMFALRIVYYHLPEEHWSTQKAEELLLNMLKHLV